MTRAEAVDSTVAPDPTESPTLDGCINGALHKRGRARRVSAGDDHVRGLQVRAVEVGTGEVTLG